MYNIDKAIKKLNTARLLLDAFGDGHEFTIHDYEELAATANELFIWHYSNDNLCYSVGWLREHYAALDIEKVGLREVEITTSRLVYESAYDERFKTYFNKCTGRKYEPKTVKQFIYRMTDAKGCSSVIEHCKEEIRYEIDRLTATSEAYQKYIEKLKKML